MPTTNPVLFDDGGGGGYDGNPRYTPIDPGSPGAPPVTLPPAAVPVPPAALLPAAAPIPSRAPTALPVPALAPQPLADADDYARAMDALLPTGRVWPDDPDTVQRRVIAALALTFARLDGDAGGLLAVSRPGAVTPLLPEWEATLGLPDPCLPDGGSFDQRAAQVRARFASAGGQSRQRYIDFAAALGFTIEIETYAPFRVGRSAAGAALGDDSWYFAWGVRVIASAGTLPASVLLCELERIKPAETSVFLLS